MIDLDRIANQMLQEEVEGAASGNLLNITIVDLNKREIQLKVRKFK